MNNLSREERSVDEIGLRVVFEKIANLLRKCGALLRRAVYLVFRRWPLFLLCLTAGLLLGYLKHKGKRPFFRASMTVAPSASIRNEFVQDQVLRLHKLVQDGNFDVLGAELQMGPDSASQIKRIEYSEIAVNQNEKDSSLVSNSFRVEVELYDTRLFLPVQEALLHHLENNPYFSRSTQGQVEKLKSRIAKLNQEIAAIDSAKRNAVSLRGPANGLVYGEPLDPTNLYKQSILMHEKLTDLEFQLKELETVHLVVGFAPITHPTGPLLKNYLLVGGIAGFLVAFILAVRLDKRRRKTSV